MNILRFVLAFCCLFLYSTCDHGLELPPPVKPGFGGRIAYKGKWPPPDSVKLLAVVGFKRYPPSNIVGDVLSGEAVFDTTLRRNVDFEDYKILTDPGKFEYVIVAQQYGANIFSDWRIIGVYSDDPERRQPRTVEIVKDTFVPNVNINVDFDHLPPQLFGKRISQ